MFVMVKMNMHQLEESMGYMCRLTLTGPDSHFKNTKLPPKDKKHMKNKPLKELQEQCVTVIKAIKRRTRRKLAKLARAARIAHEENVENILCFGNSDDSDSPSSSEDDLSEEEDEYIDCDAIRTTLQDINKNSIINKDEIKQTKALVTKVQREQRKRQRKAIDEHILEIKKEKMPKRSRLIKHKPSNDGTRLFVSVDITQVILSFVHETNDILSIRLVSRDLFVLIHSSKQYWPVFNQSMTPLYDMFHKYQYNVFPWIRYAVIFTMHHASQSDEQRNQLYSVYKQHRIDIQEAHKSGLENEKRSQYHDAHYKLFQDGSTLVLADLLNQVCLVRKEDKDYPTYVARQSCIQYRDKILNTILTGSALRNLVTAVIDCKFIKETTSEFVNARTHVVSDVSIYPEDVDHIHLQYSSIEPGAITNKKIYYYYLVYLIARSSHVRSIKQTIIKETNNAIKTIDFTKQSEEYIFELDCKKEISQSCPHLYNTMSVQDLKRALELVEPEAHNEYYLCLTNFTSDSSPDDYLDSKHVFARLDYKSKMFVSVSLK
jgi:hypothetical protein